MPATAKATMDFTEPQFDATAVTTALATLAAAPPATNVVQVAGETPWWQKPSNLLLAAGALVGGYFIFKGFRPAPFNDIDLSGGVEAPEDFFSDVDEIDPEDDAPAKPRKRKKRRKAAALAAPPPEVPAEEPAEPAPKTPEIVKDDKAVAAAKDVTPGAVGDAPKKRRKPRKMPPRGPDGAFLSGSSDKPKRRRAAPLAATETLVTDVAIGGDLDEDD